MSSNFYRRYVPPSSKPASETHSSEQASKRTSQTETFFKRYVPPAKPVGVASSDENLDVDKSVRPAKRQKQHKALAHRDKDGRTELSSAKHVPSLNGDSADANFDEANEGFGKHQRMKERYEKAQKLSDERKQQLEDTHAAANGETNGETSPTVIEQHGLEPLPQPANREEPAVVQRTPLPHWLADPIRVRTNGPGIEMSKMALGETTVKNVLKRGFDKAFAVQAAVMPMLLSDGDLRHYGDVCVSASTGSGKTLSYVLPMIEALRDKPTRLLRGLIVVPTRELVNQVKETVEMCIPHTGIKLGIAVGNKTLAEDRRHLLERRLKFDMDAFKESERRRTKPTIDELMDWDTDSEDEYDVPYGHIAALRSAIDILICTPGRLVDHVRSTKGFHLHDVQWLVIDEADKLLDQSFQQWIDTIMPELRHLPPIDDVEQELRAFLHMPQRRTVQKVILSATMTRDVSKLLPLDLYNPKLVLVEGQDAEEETEGGTVIYELPSSLRETAVTMGRDDEKPIVLFRLLQEVLATDKEKNVPAVPTTVTMDVDTGDSDTSSSESGSDSDSDGTASDSSNEVAIAKDSAKGADDTSSSGSSDSADSNSLSESEISSDDESPLTSDGERPAPRSGSKSKARTNGAVHDRPSNGILIFTNTNESAQRLSRLLAFLQPVWLSQTSLPGQQVATLTKSTASSSSRRLLSAFRSGRLPVLIASDRAARGLDVADLGLVINYDVPPGVASYVHRVGRTARAGKSGHAYTIVAHHEARWFWKEIGKGQQVRRTSGEAEIAAGSGSGAQGKVRRKEGLGRDVPEDLMRRYEAALKKLGEEAQGSKQK